MPALEVLSVAFPVFCTIGIGFFFAKYKKLSLEPILDILLYITIPALVISELNSRNILLTELGIVAIAVLFVVAVTALFSFIYLRATRREKQRGFYLPTLFMNSGNMAFPFALLAFGKDGLSVAVLYYIGVSLLVYTLGIYIVKGRGGIKEVFRLPLIYAAAFSLLLNMFDINIPGPLLKTTDMIGAATIPLMQLSLGYRLYSTRLAHLGPSIAASFIRIGGGVFAGWLIVTILGIEGTTAKVIILASSMPAAVINFVISGKYNVDNELVSSVIASSTIISIITTPIILYWLMQ